MNDGYSSAIKKIMRKPSRILTHLTCIFIIVVLIGISGYGYISEKGKLEDIKENMGIFDPFDEEMEYSQITPIFMSETFATNYDDTINYCFIIDEQYYSYIVAVYADQMDKYQDLIEYTYNEVDEPEAVTLIGKSIKIDNDMIGFAVESYNIFMGTDFVNADNFGDNLGYYYLDATEQPRMDYSVTMTYLVFAVIMGMLYYNIIIHLKKTIKRRQETLEMYSAHLLEAVDKEINQEDTVYMKEQRLYITNHYMVCSYSGFDIIPFCNISRVYGAYRGNNHIVDNSMVIIVDTTDGVQHEIVAMKNVKKFDKIKKLIIEEIKLRNPEVEYGFEGKFFTDKNVINSIEVDSEEVLSNTTSNVFLGIIGAIIGAAIGAVLWILIEKIGYIAGVAGYFMMYLSIRGYRKLSGFLDKKGQIISLIIVILMIFFANYTSYVLDYCRYYTSGSYSISNIIYAYKKIPGFLTVSDAWGEFVMNLVIGYGLTLWSSFRITKSIFSKVK